MLLAGVMPPSSAQPGVIGYVENGRFHPLLVVQAAQLGPFDARSMSLAGGLLRDAFLPSGESGRMVWDCFRCGPGFACATGRGCR